MTPDVSQALISRPGLHAALAQIAASPSRIRMHAERRARPRRQSAARPLRSAASRLDRLIAGILAAIAGAKLHRLSRELALRGVRYDRAPVAASVERSRR